MPNQKVNSIAKSNASRSAESQGFQFNDPIWLVKTADRILGPLSGEQLTQSLREREFSIIDEVTRPLARWRIIRDVPEFASVVEEVRRNQMSSREDTEVQGSQSGFTLTASEGDSAERASQETERHSTADHADFNSDKVQDAEFVESETSASSRTRSAKSSSSDSAGVRSYGVANSGRATASKTTSPLIWAGALAVFFCALFVLYRSQTDGGHSSHGQQQDFEHTVRNARAAWQVGDFTQALALYKSADQLRPRDPEVVAPLATLLIHLESQTTTAKREVNEALADLPANDNSRQKSNLLLASGLAALASDDFNEAEERFRAATSGEESLARARFNGAMTSFRQNRLPEAALRFADSGDAPASLLMSALAAMQANHDMNSPERRKADAALKKLLASSQDYLQEAQLLAAANALEAGETKSAIAHLRSALESDPEQTRLHWHDPFLYLEPLNWRELLPFCQRLNETLKSHGTKAMLGLCLFKAGDRERAVALIDEALGAASENPFLRAVNASMLMTEGRMEDARASLKMAGAHLEQSRLGLLLKGQLCLKAGDRTCAEKVFTQLTSDSPPQLAAMIALAKIYQAEGDSQRRDFWRDKAARISPTSLEVLKLQNPPSPSPTGKSSEP